MKNTTKILALITACVFSSLAFSCKKQDAMIFGEHSGVYPDIVSYTYSFLNYPGKTEDVIICPVKLFGKTVGHDRKFRAALVPDTPKYTNTADPSWYELLEGDMPADSVNGSLYIRLKYDPKLEDSIYVFYVKFVPNDDFPTIEYFNDKFITVELTAKEVQPANWDPALKGYWGTYSTRWWKFIKDATGRTEVPWWIRNADRETWWMTDDEFMSLNTLVKRALRNYNELHPDEPLTHDDGPDAGKPIPMPR